MIHVLDLTAAGCQYRGIGIEAGMAAERGARDNRPHDQEQICADALRQRQQDWRNDGRNPPHAACTEIQDRHHQKCHQREDHGIDMGLHQGNDVIGNPDIGHCLLHDKRKEDDGHRGWSAAIIRN